MNLDEWLQFRNGYPSFGYTAEEEGYAKLAQEPEWIEITKMRRARRAGGED